MSLIILICEYSPFPTIRHLFLTFLVKTNNISWYLVSTIPFLISPPFSNLFITRRGYSLYSNAVFVITLAEQPRQIKFHLKLRYISVSCYNPDKYITQTLKVTAYILLKSWWVYRIYTQYQNNIGNCHKQAFSKTILSKDCQESYWS